jgi:predicted nucleotidyltransferase
MKNILIDVSGKIEKVYLEVINIIKKSAESNGTPFFIIGALARDIIMEYFYGIKAPRLTMDIDIGIKVSTWEQFGRIISILVNNLMYKLTFFNCVITDRIIIF